MGWNYRVGEEWREWKWKEGFWQKDGEMSVWNRQTDRGGEREGGGRLMEEASGLGDWRCNGRKRKGVGWEWWRWIERGGQLGVWTSHVWASEERGRKEGGVHTAPQLHKGRWLPGSPLSFSITHRAGKRLQEDGWKMGGLKWKGVKYPFHPQVRLRLVKSNTRGKSEYSFQHVITFYMNYSPLFCRELLKPQRDRQQQGQTEWGLNKKYKKTEQQQQQAYFTPISFSFHQNWCKTTAGLFPLNLIPRH